MYHNAGAWQQRRRRAALRLRAAPLQRRPGVCGLPCGAGVARFGGTLCRGDGTLRAIILDSPQVMIASLSVVLLSVRASKQSRIATGWQPGSASRVCALLLNVLWEAISVTLAPLM